MQKLRDTFAAPRCLPAEWESRHNDGGEWQAARWRREEIERLLETLQREGAAALSAIPRARLLDAWDATVAGLLDTESPEHRALGSGALASAARLSPEGLTAGLRVVLEGLRRPATERLAELPAGRSGESASGPRAIVLASNLPALGAQPLLRALLERRPVLLKSASAEPLFAPAFMAALVARLPELAPAVAALTWRGGDRFFEDLVLTRVADVEVYGGREAIDDLAARVPRLLAHGPKASLAIVAAALDGADLETAARNLSEDVALFDQRGCLSVQAIYVVGEEGRAARLAADLAAALAELAVRWPPGPAGAAELAGVQQMRAEAEMRDLTRYFLALTAGTVVVEPRPRFRPSPGLRAVRAHPISGIESLLDVLQPWNGRIQGVAACGILPEPAHQALARLGVTRIADAGRLQRPDATWPNWGDRL